MPLDNANAPHNNSTADHAPQNNATGNNASQQPIDGDLSAEYDAAIAWIFARINYERAKNGTWSARDIKLERMADLLERLGNPQNEIPVVHVAGTKGKGSTSIMTAAILEEAGYRTGLFTSPHIDRFEERMTVNGEEPDKVTFLDMYRQCRVAVEDMDGLDDPMPPTFFEIATAIAWMNFVRQKCDIVVLEVGLGGRLDSSNVCKPAVCVITSISLDHTSVLGNTLELIAGEKAGIIKQGIPVISGATAPEARNKIAAISEQRNAVLWQLNDEISVEHHRGTSLVSAQTPLNDWQQIPLPLPGQHQARNLSLVLAVIDRLNELDWSITRQQVRDGLSKVVCPLRIEVISEDPIVIVDAAHNEASCVALVETLNESYPQRPRTLLFAATGGKEVVAMLEVLFPQFDKVVLTQYAGNPRYLPLEKLKKVAECIEHPKLTCVDSVTKAWAVANESPRQLVCVTGSFFLASEIRAMVMSQQ